MKLYRLPLHILALLAALAGTPSAIASDWELAYRGENLLVQSRPYSGSSLNEIRGTTRVKASLNAVMALLKDAEFNQQWVYRSGGAKVLQETGYARAYVHGVVDAPWPMRDRDTVVRFDYVQNQNSSEITVTISNFPEFTAAREEFVRVPEFGGHWRLKPLADGWVEVIYQVYGDPGGWIPVWVANKAAILSVKHTLLNMPAVVGRYVDVRSEFVQEPVTP